MMDCKSCEFNNNDWCKKYTMQKLKAVIKCAEESKDIPKLDKDTYVMAGKIIMFFNIIRQIDAFDEVVTQDFKEIMKELYKQLEKEINIFGIPSGNEFVELTLNDLRYRISQW